MYSKNFRKFDLQYIYLLYGILASVFGLIKLTILITSESKISVIIDVMSELDEDRKN